MSLRTVLALACLLFGVGPAQAQQAHTPAPGSAERSAILGAARPQVAADLGYRGRLLFVVESLLVSGEWALLQAQPQAPSGTALYKNCPGADEVTLVLLKRSKGSWQVDRGGTTCANDVFWLEWPSETGAPKEIFALD